MAQPNRSLTFHPPLVSSPKQTLLPQRISETVLGCLAVVARSAVLVPLGRCRVRLAGPISRTPSQRQETVLLLLGPVVLNDPTSRSSRVPHFGWIAASVWTQLQERWCERPSVVPDPSTCRPARVRCDDLGPRRIVNLDRDESDQGAELVPVRVHDRHPADDARLSSVGAEPSSELRANGRGGTRRLRQQRRGRRPGQGAVQGSPPPRRAHLHDDPDALPGADDLPTPREHKHLALLISNLLARHPHTIDRDNV